MLGLGGQGDNALLLSQIIILIGLFLAGLLLQALIHYFVQKGLSQWIQQTATLWDDIFCHSQFFFRLSTIPSLLLLYFSTIWMPSFTDWIQRIALAAIVFVSTRSLEAALTAVNDIYDDYEIMKSKPIKGYIQVGKIGLWLFALILIISTLQRSSPLLL